MHDVKKALQVCDRLVAWKMLESASGVLEQCLHKHPYEPQLLRRMGRIRLRQGQARAAVPYLELAVERDRQMQRPAKN